MPQGAAAAPLTVAVVGSGPSGFYARPRCWTSKKYRSGWTCTSGWPRRGAWCVPESPPTIRRSRRCPACTAAIAAHENFRFFGNVDVGKDVTREELTARYDAVLYAVGAQTDRRLGIPGEDLPGSVSAVDFVGWYNGHPDYAHLTFDLTGERGVVIGAGNVALDVARILCSPHERLSRTDIADHALEALRACALKEVLVVGRRGAAQAAFTTAELRELPEFTESGVDVDPAEVAEQEGEEGLSRLVKRNLAVMRGYAQNPVPAGARRVALRFQRTPLEIRGDGRVEEIVFARNALKVGDDGWVSAVDTGERETVPTSLVLRAVGYKGPVDRGAALRRPPRDHPEPERAGRGRRARVRRRLDEYVAGWIKRGPTGIIGTNKKCAGETVARLLADVADGTLRRHDRGVAFDPVGEIDTWLRGRQPHLVTEQGWRLIDAAERSLGESAGRPRVKHVLTDELLDIALERRIAS
uniref:ferredoxin--NADP(+) reductase n=1 Tax=Frankia sp. (strain EuIK1) TaxID=47227 RepID=Q938U5_FRASE|nr:adrenodoxin reductase [Frankia sp. EuIK1]